MNKFSTFLAVSLAVVVTGCTVSSPPSPYLEAAERGDAEAQINLGLCYLNGNGVPKNPDEALKWLSKAAKQDHIRAQKYLSGCYFGSHGVPEDFSQAVKWLSKAAELGDAEAQKDLSSRLGRGVKIVSGRKKGRIELEYYGMDDLNDLLDALALLQLKKKNH